MKYQSQNNETRVAIDYFKGKICTMLDIGANNGFDLSNSYDLIKQGWECICVEPSSVFKELKKLHKDNDKVYLHNVALGSASGKLKFFESGAHIPNGKDKALVSTAVEREMNRWPDVEFKEIEVDVIPVSDLLRVYEGKKIDYVSLDVEGMDLEILKQINLTAIGCDLLCVEWNGNKNIEREFRNYCTEHGMKEIHRNSENIMYAR